MKHPIGELCEFVNGGAWSDKEYVDKGISVLKVSNLQREGIDFGRIDYLPETSRARYSKHLLRKNDLVIATVGSHPSLVNSAAGRATIIPKKAEGYLLNQNAVCLRTCAPGVLAQKYLAYVGKTESFQHFIQQRGRGAANQMRIAIGSIKEYELDLPEIGIQRRISSILSAYDDLIENNLKRIKLLEELAQRTYEEWFVKFRVAGEALEVNREMGLPEGWERKRADELFTIKIGKTPPREQEEWFKTDGTGIKWASIKDMNNAATFIHNTSECITEEGVEKFNMNVASKGTVILSFKLTVGKVAIVTEDMVTNEAIAHFNIPNSSLFQKEFVYCHLKQFNYHSLGSTSSIGTAINSKIVKAMDFLEPELSVLKKFQVLIEPVFYQLENLQTQNLRLKESRDILLPRLMNGSIHVEPADSEADENDKKKRGLQVESLQSFT